MKKEDLGTKISYIRKQERKVQGTKFTVKSRKQIVQNATGEQRIVR